jgi:DNA-binding IclR family transcriptional regulator
MDVLKTVSPPSLDRALTILEELAGSHHGLRLPEIARKLGLPKSSTHCLLLGLERRSYVQRDSSGRYLFGRKVLILSDVALSGMPLRKIAYPILNGLMRRTGLTVGMAILDRSQAVLIERIYPPHLPPVTKWFGKRLDVHCTALGKALVAFQPQEQWADMIPGSVLSRHNDNTIASAKGFLKELELTCARGYATDWEESELGTYCLAVPVSFPSKQATAAISLVGSPRDIDLIVQPALVKLLKDARTAIERPFESGQRCDLGISNGRPLASGAVQKDRATAPQTRDRVRA